MGVFIEAVRVVDLIHGPDPLDSTPYLADNQSAVITVEIDVRFETYRTPLSTSDADPENKPFIILSPGPTKTGRVIDASAIFISDKSVAWKEFHVGDFFVVQGAGGTNNKSGIIEEIIDDQKGTQTLITDQIFTPEILGVFPGSVPYVGVITQQKALEFKFGLIENNEPLNYISKVDGHEQKSTVAGLDSVDTVTVFPMVQKGDKSWQFGSLTVKGNGIGQGNPDLFTSGSNNIVQAFTITHEFVISPFMLFDQWDDILGKIKPDWLFGGNSLKYVFTVDISAEEKNPNDIFTGSEETILGNVGWFDENFNGNPTNYSFSDLIYTRLDNTISTGLELTSSITKIKFSVFNIVDSPFEDGQTVMVFGFNWAPQDEALYRDIFAATTQTMDHNFIFDNIVDTLGVGGGVPRQDGTDLSVIKSISSIFINSTQIDIVVEMELDSEVVNRIAANALQRFMIYFEVADHTTQRSTSDKVQLLIDADDFFIDTSDPDMFLKTLNFMEHPSSDPETDSIEFLDAKIEDDILAITDLKFDRNTRITDEITMNSIRGQILARKNTGATFVLDEKAFALTAIEEIVDPVFSLIPNPNIDFDRGFKTPADENRGNVKFFRDFAKDLGDGFFNYRFQYPFISRWEAFVALARVSSDFFIPGDPNDGRNHDWTHYDENVDWELIYRTTLTVTKNGTPLSFVIDRAFTSLRYLLDADWDNEEINSFDENDILLESGPTKFTIKYADGLIQADFDYIGTSTPSVNDIVIVLKIDVFEEGTFKSTYWLSSAYDAHPATWWRSLDSSKRVIVSNPSANIFRGEARLIGSKLPKKKLKITGRLYDLRGVAPAVDGKLKEDGTPKQKEAGNTQKLLD